MMTSGGGAKYKGSMDCFTQVQSEMYCLFFKFFMWQTSAGAEERGLHVPDEGRRGQHSPRRGGRGRAGRLRQVPADVHRL